MEKNRKNEVTAKRLRREAEQELQSRREFFKRAAKGALPILAFTMFGSALSSCGDDDEPKPSSCVNSCSGSCKSDCSGSCKWSCAGGSDKYDW